MIRILMRFVVAVIVVFFAVGCATSPTEPPGPTEPTGPTEPSGGVRVSGLVLAFTTNAGVPGATVMFDQSAGAFKETTLVPSPAATKTVTDAKGFYRLVVPAIGEYRSWVDGDLVGMKNYVTGSAYRGDLIVRAGTTCVGRYGTITDAGTKKPVSGATVLIPLGNATTMSGSDGWYRIDLGCPENGRFGFNTNDLRVEHPSYASISSPLGRGVSGLLRHDFELQRR